MNKYLASLYLVVCALNGCGDQSANRPEINEVAATSEVAAITAFSTEESSQDVTEMSSRATGNRLTLITRVLDTRWYYAVLWYRSGAQRIVPVELQANRAVVTVNGYEGEAALGPLTKVKVFSRPLSDLTAANPPYRYSTLDDTPCRSLVLLHGYLGSTISLSKMRQTLSPLYDHAFIYTYEYNDYIGASAGRFVSWLADLKITGPGKRCDIVAHSLGGLVAREAIEERGLATHIDNLVTLGTPHLGDSWAATPVLGALSSLLLDSRGWSTGNYFVDLYRYFFNASGHLQVLADLNPTSSFLKKLNEPSGTGCTYLTVAGNLPEWGGDLVVTPRNAHWDGLADEAVTHVMHTLELGHTQLATHPLAIATVKELLEEHQPR